MIKVYRGTDGDTEPVNFECEKFGWPNKTTTGEMMFINTHFRTEKEAWESILTSWDAGVSLTKTALDYKKKELKRLKDELLNEVISRNLAKRNYRAWKTGGK